MKTWALALISTLLSVAAIEVVFRATAYDFSGRSQAQLRLPIFYRQPREPVGSVYFRRAGPAAWEGNVLATGLLQRRGVEGVYDHLPAQTIAYDRQGLRNPPGLVDWEIAVAGDSFLELGYLPSEDLYTTIVGERLERRVKNLGVSFTGNLSHCTYLREYGRAPSAKDAILVFFEGNDLADTETEFEALRVFEQTTERPSREIQKQSSFVGALFGMGRGWFEPTPPPAALPVLARAWFVSDAGETELTIGYAPPAWMSESERIAMGAALDCWRDTARELGMKPWLLYLPAKRRVLDGHLRFADDAGRRFRRWQPGQLPRLVAELSGEKGIAMIDPLPRLRQATERGELTFNSIWDTHLNRTGSVLVAEAIADALGNTTRPAEPTDHSAAGSR